MDIRMDASLGASYHSLQQQARVITEAWAADNMYCVMCGAPHLEPLQNNKPVADLLCPSCRNVFELKSHNGPFGGIIADGAYPQILFYGRSHHQAEATWPQRPPCRLDRLQYCMENLGRGEYRWK